MRISRLLLTIAILMISSRLSARLIVNELLANEPGSYTGLEWIELYNDSIQPINLSDYVILVDGSPVSVPPGVTVAPQGYRILCRRLLASATSPGFESYWGDSSGVWGDCPTEDGIALPLECTFSLMNSSGSVSVVSGGFQMSTLRWSQAGRDAFSWERVWPDSEFVVQSISARGATPGRINSVTPVQYDLRIDSVSVKPVPPDVQISIHISSHGSNSVEDAGLFVYARGVADSISLPTVASFGSYVFTAVYSFDGVYAPLAVGLSEDERIENNFFDGIVTGSSYPPILINEFLANPQSEPSSEWVELVNVSDTVIDISGWRVGDASGTSMICSNSYLIHPGDIVVLAQEEVAMTSRWSELAAVAIEVAAWPMLNNDGDMVRLVDSFGIEASRFAYETLHLDDYSWARRDDLTWGRSADRFGTPGEENRVVVESENAALRIELNSRYVSPDGDGFQDEVNIIVVGSDVGKCAVRVFDSQGRRVRTLARDQQYLPEPIIWDGLSDDGRRLPVGLYILLVERDDGKSARVALVVAR